MIPNITHSDNIAQTVNYNIKEEKGYVLDHNLASDSPKDWIRELEYQAEMYDSNATKYGSKTKNVVNPIMHLSLNLAPGEHLEDDKFAEITKEFLNELGYDDNPFFIVRHTDKEPEREHVHAVVSRFTFDGKLVKDSFEHVRASRICRKLEKKHGLFEVIEVNKNKGESLEERNSQEFRDEILAKTHIKNAIENSYKGPGGGVVNTEQFLENLLDKGVSANFNIGKNALSIRGVSFMYDGHVFSGSKLDKTYSWKHVSDKIDFDFARDRDVIIASNAMINGENSARKINDLIDVSGDFIQENDKEKLQNVLEVSEKGALVLDTLKRDLKQGNIDITKLQIDDYLQHKIDSLSLLKVGAAQLEKNANDALKAKSILNDFFQTDTKGLIQEYNDVMKSIITTSRGLEEFYKLHKDNPEQSIDEKLETIVDNQKDFVLESGEKRFAQIQTSFPGAVLNEDFDYFIESVEKTGYAFTNVMALNQLNFALKEKIVQPGDFSFEQYMNYKTDNFSFFQLNQQGKEIVSFNNAQAIDFIKDNIGHWNDFNENKHNLDLLKMKFQTLQEFDKLKSNFEKDPVALFDLVNSQLKLEETSYKARIISDREQIGKLNDKVKINTDKILKVAEENKFDWKVPSILGQYRSGLEGGYINIEKTKFDPFFDRKMNSFSVVDLAPKEKELFRVESKDVKKDLLKSIKDLELPEDLGKMAQSINYTPDEIQRLKDVLVSSNIDEKSSGIKNIVNDAYQFHRVDVLTGLNFDLDKLSRHEEQELDSDLKNRFMNFAEVNKFDWKSKSILNDYKVGKDNGLIDFNAIDFNKFVERKIDLYSEFNIDPGQLKINKDNIQRLRGELNEFSKSENVKFETDTRNIQFTQKDLATIDDILSENKSGKEKFDAIDNFLKSLAGASASFHRISSFSLMNRVNNLESVNFTKEDKGVILDVILNEKEQWKVGTALKDIENYAVKGKLANTAITAIDVFKSKIANYNYFDLNEKEKQSVNKNSDQVKNLITEYANSLPDEKSAEKIKNAIEPLAFKSDALNEFGQVLQKESIGEEKALTDLVEKFRAIHEMDYLNRVDLVLSVGEKNDYYKLDPTQRNELNSMVENDNYSFKTLAYLSRYNNEVEKGVIDPKVIKVNDFVGMQFDKSDSFGYSKDEKEESKKSNLELKEAILSTLNFGSNEEKQELKNILDSINFGPRMIVELYEALANEDSTSRYKRVEDLILNQWLISKSDSMSSFDKSIEKNDWALSIDEIQALKELFSDQNFDFSVVRAIDNYFNMVGHDNLDQDKVGIVDFVKDFVDSRDFYSMNQFEKQQLSELAKNIGEKLFSELQELKNSHEYQIFEKVALKPNAVRELSLISQIEDPKERIEAIKGFVEKQVALHEANFKSRFKDILGRINLHQGVFLSDKDEKNLLEFSKGLNYDWRILKAFSDLENRLNAGGSFNVNKDTLRELFLEAVYNAGENHSFDQSFNQSSSRNMVVEFLDNLSNDLMSLHYMVERDMSQTDQNNSQVRRDTKKGKKSKKESGQSQQDQGNDVSLDNGSNIKM